MKTFNLLYLLVIVFIGTGCHIGDGGWGWTHSHGNNIANIQKEIIFSKDLQGDESYLPAETIVIENDVIFGLSGSSGNNTIVERRNGETGDVIWTWNSQSSKRLYDIHISDHHLIINTIKEVIVLNTNTGTMIWKKNINDIYSGFNGSPYINIVNKKIYAVIKHFSLNKTSIIEFDINNSTYNEVYSITKEENDGKTPVLSLPSLYTNNDGNKIMFVYLTSLSSGDDNHSLLSYSISTNEVMWKIDDLFIGPKISKFEPIYDEGQVFAMGDKFANSYDAQTGALKWTTDLSSKMTENGISRTSPLIMTDKLYIKTNGSEMFCLNRFNGNVIWEQFSIDYESCRYLRTYKEEIYFSTFKNKRIFGVNINDGEVIYKRKSPNSPNTYWGKDISINPTKGYLYTADTKNGICFDLK